MNVTETKRRMLGEARKAARLYANLVGTITRIACDDGMTLDIQWKASNFAHLCGLEYYADDNRTRRLPARRLYTDLLSGHGISVKRVAPTGDARWLARKTDVIASAFALNDASMVVESGNSRIRLYMGNTVWCIGLGRSGEDGPYYPQSLRKGNAAKEKNARNPDPPCSLDQIPEHGTVPPIDPRLTTSNLQQQNRPGVRG